MAKKSSVSWLCTECGLTQPKWTGSCDGCKNWNTFKEFRESSSRMSVSMGAEVQAKPVKIGEVDIQECVRVPCNFNELNRALGGGIVAGSFILLAGNPGIGKSTIMLQLCDHFCQRNMKILYVSGEESLGQTSLRAERLGVKGDIYLYAETELGAITKQIEEMQPDILVIDSIQILYQDDVQSLPGSVTQIREVAMRLMRLAKQKLISTFVIGHVTKSGDIAGPKILEHMVDVVLDFEGDRELGYRLIRSKKNRFGPTDEVAIFEMTAKGLLEISNPSNLFLEERVKEVTGSCIIATLEGSRALLVEVQSLVATSAYASATRRSTGFDPNRILLLLAVLEKKLGYQMQGLDVFVSIIGGLKVVEPAADLGIVFAITSAFSNKSVASSLCIFGEVGLSGEIRSVSKIESRVKEAIHMGFKSVVMPKKNLDKLSSAIKKKIDCIGFDRVKDAIEAYF
jgi:DNA repair protein RadA/Sms